MDFFTDGIIKSLAKLEPIEINSSSSYENRKMLIGNKNP